MVLAESLTQINSCDLKLDHNHMALNTFSSIQVIFRRRNGGKKSFFADSLKEFSFFFKTSRYFRATAKTTEHEESTCINVFCLGKVLNKFNKGGREVEGLSFKS